MQLNLFLIIAFLFMTGSIFGWVIEVIFRRFFSKKNPERKWLNPGFCLGPCLPLYGVGLTALFFLAYFGEKIGYGATFGSKVVLFFIMALIMTIIEFLAGLLSIKVFKTRLWDYRNEWGNIMGLVCPKFTFFWAILSAAYYFLVQPAILNDLIWLSKNLTYSFVIGLFYGIFLIDVLVSSGTALKLRSYAMKNNTVIDRAVDSVDASARVGGFGQGFLNFLYNSRVKEK